ncbi:MAG: hypothetical protein F4057_05145 [Acidobacteria bacterium]|nr:hypothetical protein [Acidobacteriota bacterium]MYI74711.1 hypothetical protein [Acidobacteriota bacterium]
MRWATAPGTPACRAATYAGGSMPSGGGGSGGPLGGSGGGFGFGAGLRGAAPAAGPGRAGTAGRDGFSGGWFASSAIRSTQGRPCATRTRTPPPG